MIWQRFYLLEMIRSCNMRLHTLDISCLFHIILLNMIHSLTMKKDFDRKREEGGREHHHY